MATNPQNTSGGSTKSFERELVDDIKDFHLPPGSWTYARNAINNSVSGDLGDIGNEPSNKFCAAAPYTIIGAIHLYSDRWAIFSTDDTDSEIGLFQEETCAYTTVVNDQCLGFKKTNLIIGQAKQNFDCTWQVYWSDQRLNPDRTMNMDNPPFIQNCVTVNGCLQCTPTTNLDCDAIRLARFVKSPCIRVQKGASGGSLPNGSYFAVISYTINGQKVTDYFPYSNIQPIFGHDNVSSSLDIFIDDIDDRFDEFELVVVSIVNQQTSARRIGIYNTRQSQITLDNIHNELPEVPLEFIPIRNPVFDASDGIYENGDYLIRVGPVTKFDFNYQPLANQITTKWVSVEYPADYYRKGGNQAGHMRDEVYPYFIRWVYDTGDRSASYHIPGRGSVPSDLNIIAGPDAAIEIAEGITPFRWRVQNTATVTSLATSTLPDGGLQIAEGLMGYWESTELYPDNTPQIWNANVPGFPEWDLCGQPIRHHRFPDNALHPTTHHFSLGAGTIRIMGVKFENIQQPVDNLGNPITSIIGYEILRGSREGNRTVIAKGMLNNTGSYNIQGGTSPRTGLYPNYPYNDLNPDKFISVTDTNFIAATCSINGYFPNPFFRRDVFTFHSPDTQFKNPFLAVNELKVYGELGGTVEGQFVEPANHPKHKLITDLTFYVALIAGVGIAIVGMNGTRRVRRMSPRILKTSGAFAGPAGVGNEPFDFGASGIAAATTWGVGYGTSTSAFYDAGALLLGNVAGLTSDPYYAALSGVGLPLNAALGILGYTTDIEQEDGKHSSIPLILRVLQAIPTFTHYLSDGVDNTIRLIKAVIPWRQYALQYQSHCQYDIFAAPQINNNRRIINDSIYLGPDIQDFGANWRVNNLYRGRSVVIETGATVADPIGTDNTRQRVGDLPGSVTHANPLLPFNTSSSCHYTALKQRMRNQYGQIDGIRQVMTSTCVSDKSLTISPVFFNGDTYVTRYTEKNTMPFFYSWMDGQPNGYEFDYRDYKNVPYPAYWMDTEEFDLSEFVQSIVGNILNPGAWVTPSDKHVLDRAGCPIAFGVREAYMYLFSSGVRDFFVEAEVNTDLRDWEEQPSQRHYDPYLYTDLAQLFHTSIIKSGNFFKYDYSLSISKLFTNFISWGNTQDRNYDPLIAQTCFSYYPNRAIYSLPQQFELKRDSWLIYLANNYKDFKSQITTIKPVAKNGALIMFQTESPVQFLGVDELETDAGTKITLGDGGLFSQPLQNIVNTDDPIEYGSCQNRLSVINTPAGLFWMSQNQGKIFKLAGNGPQEISNDENRWWFANYLPYMLTEDFPDFELKDNPVIGIACQAIYDNENALVYFTKRDFKLRTDITSVVTYVNEDNFLVDGVLQIKLGDPAYFEDASWTFSYDPKSQSWISYHDWHPNLLMPSKQTFMSVRDGGIWVHNYLCDSYCNFYGVDYPFEIEFTAPTAQEVTTLRSVEYMLEVYRYAANCYDRFHVLDFNFDDAVIHNTEQCSGLLRLNLTPKNNAPLIIQYPIVSPGIIDILFSKEENKYRFNQFWDITDDRGEFNLAAQRMIWNTAPNGYVRALNPINLNYNKPALQRKKFRHYTNSVLLRRRVCGNNKMLFMLANTKTLVSLR